MFKTTDTVFAACLQSAVTDVQSITVDNGRVEFGFDLPANDWHDVREEYANYEGVIGEYRRLIEAFKKLTSNAKSMLGQ